MNSLFSYWASTLRRNSLLLVFLMLPILGINTSKISAGGIDAPFPGLEVSLPVTDLETLLKRYIENGILPQELAIYQNYLPKKDLQEFREILLTPLQVNQPVFAQFLHTPQGEFLVYRLAKVIKSDSGNLHTGFSALRIALTAAAAEPEGLTVLNILEHYPQKSIRLDLRGAFLMVRELQKVIQETDLALDSLNRISNIEAAQTTEPGNFAELLKLRQQGIFTPEKHTLKFFDAARERLLVTDIYVPLDKRHQQPTPTAVIVISHGLGADSSNFEYLAQHLASHGLAVVVPNHPGSDAQGLRLSLIQGNSSIIQAEDFKNRPLDIKYILNELEKLNHAPPFPGRLNLKEVGVVGQSLGGYTALALAGAKVNFQQLENDCQPQVLHKTWNMSLLFQCTALSLELERSNLKYSLQDDRVKAAIAINPITSGIFGEAGLRQVQIPVMIIGSSDDTITPTLQEQIKPFTWLKSSHKYLVMLMGGTHFSAIGDAQSNSHQIALHKSVVGDTLQARDYIMSVSTPFFQRYLNHKSENIHLSAAYAKNISTDSLGLIIVKSLEKW